MKSRTHVLISLEPRFAEAILSGHKLVELRRRPMNIRPGSVVWLYSKLPVASIVGCAEVKDVHQLSPTATWERFGGVAGVSRRELYAYFQGIEKGNVLELTRPHRLETGVGLEFLRLISRGFHPPQFFTFLKPHTPIYEALVTS